MKNPIKDKKDSRRVYRGGSWLDGSRLLPVSDRLGTDPVVRYKDHGFRIVRNNNENLINNKIEVN